MKGVARTALIFLVLAPAGFADPGAWALANLGAFDPVARNAARRILAQAGSGMRPRLLEALASSEWRTREGVLEVLAWAEESPEPEPLVPLVEDPAWPVRRALAYLWGWHRLGRELPRRLLADPFHDVRAAAVLALAAQPGPPARELGHALLDRAAPVREAAWRVLVYAPSQLILEQVPGERGQRARRRALRALATRPTPGQLPVLSNFLEQVDASLGEKLIALQALLSLGLPAGECAALVLAGLQDPNPAVRGTAVWTGLSLSAADVARLGPEGFSLGCQEAWENFIKIAGQHGNALAPELPAALDALASWWQGNRKAMRTGLFVAGFEGNLASLLCDAFDSVSAERLQRIAGLAEPEKAPDLARWLLDSLEASPTGIVAEALRPVLLRHVCHPEARAYFLEHCTKLSARQWVALARELLRGRPEHAPDELLLALEQPGLFDTPSARREYLLALDGFPRRPNFLTLVRRIFQEDPDPGVRLAALRIWINVSGELAGVDPGLVFEVAAWPGASEALQRACMQVLASVGAWEHLEALFSRLESGRAQRLKLQVVHYVRDRQLRGGLPLLERWAANQGGGALVLASVQALAMLGVEAAQWRLAGGSPLLGEAELFRAVLALERAPQAIARQAVETWSGAEMPEYYLAAACTLAEKRPDLPFKDFLEGVVRGEGADQARAAALRALVAREERALPASLLPELLLAPAGSQEEGLLAELLDAIGKGSTPWAVPFLWRSVLERHLRHPLKEVARTLDPSPFASRSIMARARLMCGHLYAQDDESVAVALVEFLRHWEGSPGRALLGGDLLLALIDETREQRGRPRRPLIAHRLAELGRGLPPRGQPLGLLSRMILAEQAEAEGRWIEGAALHEEALRILLLGEIDPWTQEQILGETVAAAGRFPVARIAALPCLLKARAHLDAGEEQAAAEWIAEAMERGGVDFQVRRLVESMRR